MKYAGIGSRKTPRDVLRLMTSLSFMLRREGWALRSGRGGEADRAFEAGGGERAEIFLPWLGFGGWIEPLAKVYSNPTPEALAMAKEFHPNWSACSQSARRLHARNCHQILGIGLDDPVLIVLCWTPDGSRNGSTQASGGTGQALRIATAYDVPVFNLQREEDRAVVTSWL